MSNFTLWLAGNGSTLERPILSLTQLIDIRAEEQANLPAIHTIIPEDSGEDDHKIRTLNYMQLRKAIERLAWHYSSPELNIRLILDTDGSPPPVKVVGIFMHTSLTLTFTEFALHRLGLTSLLISPNNSASAVAALLQETDAHHVIVNDRLLETAKEAQDILNARGYELILLQEKVFAFWGPDGVDDAEVPPYPTLFTPEQEHHRPAIILHSSGSTGHPKPLVGTHRTVTANGAWNFGMVAATLLPLFHGYGHHSTLRCISCAKPLLVFPPHLPLTAGNVVRFFDAFERQSGQKLQQLFAVAYVLKLLTENEESANRLAGFDLVTYAGSAVPDEIGDKLTAGGVNLLSQYGTTETGVILTSARTFDEDKNWNWLRPHGKAVDFINMEERGGGTYEAVVRVGWPSLAVSNRPDGSFATKDLFIVHPEHSDWYKYVGRLDDTLTQTLGEKTNPVPIELTLRGTSEYIRDAIVFGAGKPQIGALILPSESGAGLDRATLMDRIWPAVQLANKDAPSHSQLIPEMIQFLHPDTDVPLATKGTILRPACYAKFEKEIEAVYTRYESEGTSPKITLSQPELEVFIQEAISRILGGKKAAQLQKNTDLFNFGIDSLQSTRIRTVIVKELNTNGRQVSQNVVYENPTIEKLSRYLYTLRTNADSEEDVAVKYHRVMLALVEKYASRLDWHTPSANVLSNTTGHTIVLTGATGSLGAHIMHHLLLRSDVLRVIALVRAPSDDQALNRIEASLRQRKLPTLEERSGASRVTVLAAELDREELGLKPEVYGQIRDQATSVIHNAWSVNFNLDVESFEADNIRGAFNLINLCLQSPYSRPASFYFSSSVSARQGIWTETADEIIMTDPAYAAPTGYARSKWIMENICQRAAAGRELHVGVLRIGQLVGDSKDGIWSTTEAIPLLFRSAQVIRALPELDDYPSFLPVNIAAAGISEIVAKGDLGPSAAIYHVVNPNTKTSWNVLLGFLKESGLEFDVVDRHEWLIRLSNSPIDLLINPTYKLIEFFRNRYGKPALQRSIAFSTTQTNEVAPSISTAPPLDADLVSKWVARWREVGFLS